MCEIWVLIMWRVLVSIFKKGKMKNKLTFTKDVDELLIIVLISMEIPCQDVKGATNHSKRKPHLV